MQNLLIVIDLQKGWRHPTATEQTMENCVQLCQKFQGKIIHCRFRNSPKSLFHTQLNWTRFTQANDTDEIPEIAALGLPTYWRQTYTCVDDQTTPLIQAAKHVYICGVFTDISVAATAMGIFDLGVPVSVVTDCVGTLHGAEVHKYSLRSLDHAIGTQHMVTAAQVLDA